MSNLLNESASELETKVLHTRKASECAELLLPLLRADMRVLDCGCGPGSITLDLASILKGGQIVGIDISSDRIARSRADAQRAGVRNAEFHVGDVARLAFDAESFDVVFMHGLLYHLSDPISVVREGWRVLRSGSIVAVRDSDIGGNVLHPTNRVLQRALKIDEQLLSRSGDPFFGRRHKSILRTAGFQDIQAIARYDNWTRTPADAMKCGQDWAQYFATIERENILNANLSTDDELREIEAAFLDWGRDPDAVYVRCRFAAIGFKP